MQLLKGNCRANVRGRRHGDESQNPPELFNGVVPVLTSE